MNNIIVVIVLLGGCFLMHSLFMRKGSNHDNQDNTKDKKDDEGHGGHSCCH